MNGMFCDAILTDFVVVFPLNSLVLTVCCCVKLNANWVYAVCKKTKYWDRFPRGDEMLLQGGLEMMVDGVQAD